MRHILIFFLSMIYGFVSAQEESIEETKELAAKGSEEAIEILAYTGVTSAILSCAATNAIECKNVDPSALILSLSYSHRPAAQQALASLLDYDLGESLSEAVSFAITSQGTSISSLLKKEKSESPNCLKGEATDSPNSGYMERKCMSRIAKIEYIDSLLEMISRGEIFSYVW